MASEYDAHEPWTWREAALDFRAENERLTALLAERDAEVARLVAAIQRHSPGGGERGGVMAEQLQSTEYAHIASRRLLCSVHGCTHFARWDVSCINQFGQAEEWVPACSPHARDAAAGKWRQRRAAGQERPAAQEARDDLPTE